MRDGSSYMVAIFFLVYILNFGEQDEPVRVHSFVHIMGGLIPLLDQEPVLAFFETCPDTDLVTLDIESATEISSKSGLRKSSVCANSWLYWQIIFQGIELSTQARVVSRA